jgi:hypothetical protein
MNAASILRDLTERGAQVFRDGDSLRVRAPRGMITESLREQLREHKPEILEMLAVAKIEATSRPVLHFRLNSSGNAWATIIGRVGESRGQLEADLRQRFSAQLVDVRSP